MTAFGYYFVWCLFCHMVTETQPLHLANNEVLALFNVIYICHVNQYVA